MSERGKDKPCEQLWPSWRECSSSEEEENSAYY
jgi:hypothetical protein